MATMRESLKKLAEVAKPVPGDEQDFVAKHGMKIMDFQGKDSISPDSPYDHILKNVAVVKAPGQPGKDDHGHDAPGESEAAYHIPESREAKLAKLSEMMGNDKDEDEEDEDEDEEDDEDEKEIKEAKKQVVGVEMHYKHATKKPFKVTHFSVQDAERGRKEYEKMGYKLVGKKAQMGEEAEQVDEVKAVKAYDKEGKLVGRYRSMDHAKQMKPGHTYKVEEEVEQVDENLPLLPKQKEIAKDLLKKEMEVRKKQRNDNRQAGTPRITESEESRREENDKVRMARVATPRPHTPETVQAMRHRLETVKKQIIDKT